MSDRSMGRLWMLSRGLALLLLLVVGTGAAKAGPVILTGQVRDKAAGTPLPGAVVALYAPDVQPGADRTVDPVALTQTLQNGSFILRAPDKGQYRLAVDKGGYLSLRQPLEVTAAGRANLDLALSPFPDLTFRLEGPDGKPLTEGTVQVAARIYWHDRPGRDLGIEQDVPARPTIALPWPRRLPQDELPSVSLTVRNPKLGIAQAALDPMPEIPPTLRLGPGVTLAGMVLDARGQPARQAAINLESLERGGAGRLIESPLGEVTAADGHFEAPQMPEGEVAVDAFIPGSGRHLQLVDLAAPRTEILVSPADPTRPPRLWLTRPPMQNLAAGPTLPPGAGVPVTGRLTTVGTAMPVPDADVALFAPGNADPLDVVRTRPDGTYHLQAPAPGRYRLRVEGPDLVPLTRSVQTTTAGAALPDLPVELSRPLQVKVLDPEGRPVAGVPVQSRISLQIRSYPEEIAATAVPNADGILTFPDVQVPASWIKSATLFLRRAGLGAAQVTLDTWPPDGAVIHLQAGAVLSGTVLDRAGKSLPGAVVAVGLSTGHGLQNTEWEAVATTNEQGRFQIPSLLPQPTAVVAALLRAGGRPQIVDLTNGSAEVTLGPREAGPARLQGR